MEIRLRALEPEDACFMYEAETDEAAWMYSDYFAPLSRELLQHYALTYDAEPFRSGQLRLIIEANGQPVGIADLFNISAKHRRAECGIYILPAYRGSGIGTRALGLMEEYCLKRLGLNQISATVAADNIAALTCFKKTGFKISGTLEEWIQQKHHYLDAHILQKKL